MKKSMLTIAALLFAAVLMQGAPVSQKQALEYALNYTGAGTLTLAAQTAGYYAFDIPGGGWVLISADDCAVPVLAHVDKGSFPAGRMPANMKGYLGRVSGNIGKAAKAGIAPSHNIRTAWASKGVRTKAATSSKVLATATWGQDAPYNQTAKARLGTDTEVCTGCIATAMAIVLSYHRWPATGTGTIPAYTSNTGKGERFNVPAVNIGSYTYNWSVMPLGLPSTDAEKTAVADLMFHCGAMVQMEYSVSGSGAASEDIIPALVEYMSYSPNARELYRDEYSDYEWLRMIMAEIDADRPIIYGGSDEKTEEGHQFVIDGYNSDSEIHVNWGWDGDDNGWYAVNYLGSMSVGDVFSWYDSGIFGLAPQSGSGSIKPEIYLASFTSDGYEDYGLKLASGKIAKGSTFKLDAAFYNDCSFAYNGAVRAALVSKDGTLKEFVGAEKTLTVDAAEYYAGELSSGFEDLTGYSCTVTSDIAPGDCICLFCKTTDGGWARVGGYNHVESDDYYNYYSVGSISATGISYIYVPDTLAAGNRFYFSLVTDGRLPESITWTFDGTSPSQRSVKLTSGTHTVKAVVEHYGGSTETLVRKIAVQ